MNLKQAVPFCPVCGFSSIYTDGDGPCSVRCALKLAEDWHTIHDVPLQHALCVVREEAEARGLPSEPRAQDIRAPYYRYVFVNETRSSVYWKIDRDLLSAGLNVEYVWTGLRPHRGRVYRFAPSLLSQLPESIVDYKVRNISHFELRTLCREAPYWYFLPAR